MKLMAWNRYCWRNDKTICLVLFALSLLNFLLLIGVWLWWIATGRLPHRSVFSTMTSFSRSRKGEAKAKLHNGVFASWDLSGKQKQILCYVSVSARQWARVLLLFTLQISWQVWMALLYLISLCKLRFLDTSEAILKSSLVENDLVNSTI